MLKLFFTSIYFMLVISCSNLSLYEKHSTYETLGYINTNILTKEKYYKIDKKVKNILFSDKKLTIFAYKKSIKIIDNKNNKTSSITVSSQPIIGKAIDNIIAILAINNKVYLIDKHTNKIIFTKQEKPHNTITNNIANFQKYKNFIVIPFLNGKISFFNIKTKHIDKNYNVSQTEYFKNLLDMKTKNDLLIAVSKDSIFIKNYSNFNIRRDIKPRFLVINDDIFISDREYIYKLKNNTTTKIKNKMSQEIIYLSKINNHLFALLSNKKLIILNKKLDILKTIQLENINLKKFHVQNKKIYSNNAVINLEDI